MVLRLQATRLRALRLRCDAFAAVDLARDEAHVVREILPPIFVSSGILLLHDARPRHLAGLNRAHIQPVRIDLSGKLACFNSAHFHPVGLPEYIRRACKAVQERCNLISNSSSRESATAECKLTAAASLFKRLTALASCSAGLWPVQASAGPKMTWRCFVGPLMACGWIDNL